MKTFLRLLTFLLPFGGLIALAIALGTIVIASNMLLLSMASYVISAAALGPLLLVLTIPIYIVRFTGVSRAVSRYVERLLSHDVTFRLLARLRVHVFERLEPQVPGNLDNYRSGDLLTRLVSDIDELQNIYLRVVAPIFVAAIIVVLTFLVFGLFSSALAWVALLFLVLTGCAVPWLTGWLSRGLGRQQLATRAELHTHIVDSLQGMPDLLAYGAARGQLRQLGRLDTTLANIQKRMARISGLQQALYDLLMNLSVWTILILAIPLVATKTINGVYLAFLALVILASFEAIQPLAQAFQLLGHSLAAGERLFAVTDAVPTVIEHTHTLPLEVNESIIAPLLEFVDVQFSYDATATKALDAISFRLCPQQHIAIVGPSGAGKSTLVNLIVRFWETSQGTIRVQGQDARDYTLDGLRSLVSVVAQDTYLFNDTIRNNILLADPDASEQALEQVLMQSGLADLISQLPSGLETWIGEQGVHLSGGERQRVAIARALLKDAPLLILDEPTANLDPLTERTLLETLKILMKQHTVLMITHHLVGMEAMDEILVMDAGRIVQCGAHAQLVQEEGLYQQLLAMQNNVVAFV
jgi:ATP-binding cassette, subfamily C, bacterial CydC